MLGWCAPCPGKRKAVGPFGTLNSKRIRLYADPIGKPRDILEGWKGIELDLGLFTRHEPVPELVGNLERVRVEPVATTVHIDTEVIQAAIRGGHARVSRSFPTEWLQACEDLIFTD
jgi:hypothetical protein